jgi:integrase
MNNDLIKALKHGDPHLYDTPTGQGVKGLHVIANADGTKTFYLYYRLPTGKQRRQRLGLWDSSFPLAQARRKAKETLLQVGLGNDPAGEKAAYRGEMRVSDLYAFTKANYWENPHDPRFIQSGWAKDVDSFYRNHVAPAFGDKRLSDVTDEDVEVWHQKYRKKMPVTGNRALGVLSTMFDFGMRRKKALREAGFTLPKIFGNPCTGIEIHPEPSRDRFATEEEIRNIVKAINLRALRNPASCAFLYALMTTGSRPEALKKATWEQLEVIERDGKVYGLLTFRGKTSDKTGDDEKVIIPPGAMLLLARLPRRAETDLIFGMTKGPIKLWYKIRKEANCPDLWMRDLRRTFATIGYSGGVDKYVVSELLNHRSVQTTAVYAKLMDQSRFKALDQVAGRLEEIVKEEA